LSYPIYGLQECHPVGVDGLWGQMFFYKNAIPSGLKYHWPDILIKIAQAGYLFQNKNVYIIQGTK
jgi:hypothetical protein